MRGIGIVGIGRPFFDEYLIGLLLAKSIADREEIIDERQMDLVLEE